MTFVGASLPGVTVAKKKRIRFIPGLGGAKYVLIGNDDLVNNLNQAEICDATGGSRTVL
ncbi:hypothetical protein V7146_16260 [Gottfriedia acidiceleris]|uniref:hypothetical protein n=1 Tax=Gottfriedia acidiceleris TaxID=371036 RepID=UPI003000E071